MHRSPTRCLTRPALTAIAMAALAASAAERPNILLMMVDDLGFSDFGCYGSEIETPRIDRLAQEGLRFSQFYNTAKCHSSRVCLLSGLYCGQAGDARLSRATTIAAVLGDAGYSSSMTGKWHLSGNPVDFGFRRYWGHLSGATDFFAGNDSFRLDGERWDSFGEDFYTTDANVDWAMKFIGEALAAEQPFFHYIAFNAPHYPLQAPEEDIRNYLGRYDTGWEAIREARFAKQKKLGLFPQSMALPPLPEHVPAWDGLSDRRREFESLRMAVYAAMVGRVDRNIGRLLDWLEERGALQNTLILLCSDNGGCPFERSRKPGIPPWEGGSFYTYDASWATVSNTPLKHYKQTQHEGGISSPLIAWWPGHIEQPGRWERSPGHLIDIMASCIEAGNARYPRDGSVEPLTGKSLLPLFRGLPREGHDELYFEFGGCRALRRGDWKAVSFYQHKWELYNLADDRCEQDDLADRNPGLVAELAGRWRQLAVEMDKLPEARTRPVGAKPSPANKDSWHKANADKDWTPPESKQAPAG